jgi:N4-gp56 family major capsid protein
MALTISATDTEVTLPINAVFQQTFLRQATPLAPYFAGTKPTALNKQGGSNVVKWRRVGAITPSTTALSEQQTTAAYMGGRSSDVTSNTSVTATIAKYGQFVILTEEAEDFNPAQQVDEIVKSLAIAGGRSLNMLQRNVAEDNLTKVYAGGVASTGAVVSKITLASINSVINTLTRNSATMFTPMSNGDSREGTSPILGAYWGLCHPDAAYDITQLPGFKSVETYAGQVRTVPGEFGLVQGAGRAVRFIQSEDATIDLASGGTVTSTGLRGSGNVDIYTTVIYGQDCLGSVGLGKAHTDGIYTASQEEMPNSIELIVKGFNEGGTSDPFNEIKTVAYKVWHAGAVLNSTWGRAIISGATSL